MRTHTHALQGRHETQRRVAKGSPKRMQETSTMPRRRSEKGRATKREARKQGGRVSGDLFPISSCSHFLLWKRERRRQAAKEREHAAHTHPEPKVSVIHRARPHTHAVALTRQVCHIQRRGNQLHHGRHVTEHALHCARDLISCQAERSELIVPQRKDPKNRHERGRKDE